MIIKSTRNSLTAAMMFTVLSGVSTLSNANLGAVEVKSVHVSYADLNLAQESGQEALYERLKVAAEGVCGGVKEVNLSAILQQRKCYKEALDSAIGQIGSEGLTTIHEG